MEPGTMPARKIKMPPLADLLNTEDASAYAGVTVRTLRRWADDGKITRYHFGRRLRYSRTELDSLVTKAA